MDFAFSTVLVLLIILPGFVARFFYFTHPFSSGARKIEITTEFFWAFVPGIFIHFIYISLVEFFTKYTINFDYVLYLLIGKEDNNKLNEIAGNIHANIIHILWYIFILLILSCMIGLIFKRLVLILALDLRTEFFRFGNKWYYILSGRLLDMDEYRGGSKDISLIGIDALCNVGGESIIYMGELVNYYLSGDGSLDALLLRYPGKRKLSDDANEGHRDEYYEIPSDYLYLPYKEIININVRYFKVTN